MARLDEPLTFPRAAKAIGWTGKWSGKRLLRFVRRREREIGKKFGVRDEAGRLTKVSVGALHRHCPELRPSRVDALAASLRPLVQEVDRRTEQLVESGIARRVSPRFQKIEHRVTKLEQWRDLVDRFVTDAKALL